MIQVLLWLVESLCLYSQLDRIITSTVATCRLIAIAFADCDIISSTVVNCEIIMITVADHGIVAKAFADFRIDKSTFTTCGVIASSIATCGEHCYYFHGSHKQQEKCGCSLEHSSSSKVCSSCRQRRKEPNIGGCCQRCEWRWPCWMIIVNDGWSRH